MSYRLYAAVGDSITYGLGATDQAHAYPALAGVRWQARPGQCLSVATDLPLAWPSFLDTFGGDVKTFHDLGIGVIVTEIGIHELALGTPDEVLIAAYQELQATGEQWDVQVILSPITPWAASRLDISEAMRSQRIRINKWIRTHRYYVDYAGALQTPDGLAMEPRYDSGDGRHPGNAGHVAMAQCLSTFISDHRFKA